ncbi:hypothetical protein VHEMI09160 [[Torrubiella] hemipterigena]|uniref:Hydrophobin n=1 Tax=[Torrubiella] hemipterigena TaxID=1531966 RepID=A0A0A1TR07_9HYPO|nr:hypothetical protein VHEMI09160 [[Torrubiella] hemipterigena]
MQFLVIASLVTAVAAAGPCPAGGLYANPLCCTEDNGLAGTICFGPSGSATTAKALNAECAKLAKKGACCAPPIVGQGLMCRDAI